MTVEEMGLALGLRREERIGGWWHWSDRTGVVAEPESTRIPSGAWYSWPEGGLYDGRKRHESEHAAMSRLYALRIPETTGTPTPAPIVEPGADTARESSIPSALDTRAVLEWLDSPVPLDEDRRPRFLRMAEMVGRGIGGGR